MIVIFIPTLREASGVFTDLSAIQISQLRRHKKTMYPLGGDPTSLTPIYLTGVGKTNTAMSCTKVFMATKPTYAILLGVAGAYRSSGLVQGDAVVVAREHFVDEAALFADQLTLTSELGFPICPDNAVELDTSIVHKIKKICKCELIHSNTVSLLSSNDYLAELYSKKTTTQIENMEGASFALVAREFGVKPVEIRAISNHCGDRDKQGWQMDKALSVLATISKHLADLQI